MDMDTAAKCLQMNGRKENSKATCLRSDPFNKATSRIQVQAYTLRPSSSGLALQLYRCTDKLVDQPRWSNIAPPAPPEASLRQENTQPGNARHPEKAFQETSTRWDPMALLALLRSHTSLGCTPRMLWNPLSSLTPINTTHLMGRGSVDQLLEPCSSGTILRGHGCRGRPAANDLQLHHRGSTPATSRPRAIRCGEIPARHLLQAYPCTFFAVELTGRKPRSASPARVGL
ncbi:hypothetical protein C8R43DRAFT_965405 [Mycena crocata]|nr:hypothetical protein C8R43DRAFT_965405 [Mycena crocata]